MAVSYNRLWKLLIDKGITKTEMHKQTGISKAYSPKWERMKPYQWTHWRGLPPLWITGLTILWKSQATQKKKAKRGIEHGNSQ